MSGTRPLFGAPQTEATNDDYYTPRWLFDAMGLHFDLDVASPPGGPPHVPCDRYYTMEDDGLTAPWQGTVWMNPPFSNPAPWVERFIEHGNGVALLPVSKAAWYAALWSDPTVSVGMTGSDFKLLGGRSISFQTFLAAIGVDSVAAIRQAVTVRCVGVNTNDLT